MHDAGHVCSPPFASVRDVCLRVATTRRLWRSRRYQPLKDLPDLDFGIEKTSSTIQTLEIAAPLLLQSSTMESPPVSPTLLSSPASSSPTTSSPREILTPATSLSSTTTTSHPSAIATLTTIPPELLLRIISFLPSSSYHHLTQTSTYLRLSFNTHASQICNSYILFHLAKEAELLNSSMQDGWLLPSISFLVSSSSRSPTSSGDDLRSSSLTLSALQTWLSPVLPRVRDRIHISLAAPGPQYLRFLEEYAKDIGIRAQLVWNGAEEHMDEVSQEDEEKRKKDYAWQIFTYAVRPFMRKLEDSTRYTPVLPAEEVNNANVGGDRINMDGTEVSGGKKINLCKIWKILGFNKLKGMKRKVAKHQGRMFGELPSSQQQPQNISSTSMGSGRQVIRADTRRALLWYHGVGGLKTMGPCTVPSSPQAPLQTTAEVEEDHERKTKDHFRVFKTRASAFGHSLAVSSGKIMRPFVGGSCFGKKGKGRFEKL